MFCELDAMKTKGEADHQTLVHFMCFAVIEVEGKMTPQPLLLWVLVHSHSGGGFETLPGYGRLQS